MSWINELAARPPERRQVRKPRGNRLALVMWSLAKFLAGEHFSTAEAEAESGSGYRVLGVRLFFGVGAGGPDKQQGLQLDDGTEEHTVASQEDGVKAKHRKRTIYPATRRNCGLLLKWLAEHGQPVEQTATDLGFQSEDELREVIDELEIDE